MTKKGALAVASAVLGIVLATTVAIALNLGILDRTADQVAVASPTDEPTAASQADDGTSAPTTEPAAEESGFRIFPEGTEVITIYVDDPTPSPAPAAPRALQPQAPAPAPQAPAAPTLTPTPRAKMKAKPKKTAPGSAPAQPPSPVPTTQAEAEPPAPTPTAPPTPTSPPTATPAGPGTTYPVYDVGSGGQVALAFDGSSITFWGAYPNSGWEYAVEDDGPRKVKVAFRRTSGGQEIEFQAELDGSRIKTEVGD